MVNRTGGEDQEIGKRAARRRGGKRQWNGGKIEGNGAKNEEKVREERKQNLIKKRVVVEGTEIA